MARDVKTLLSKKGWTGQEVGQALMASLIHEVKNLGKDVKPLFTQADLDRMENSLNTRPDYISYGVYRSIYSAVVDGFNKGQGLYQQFYNGFYRYMMLLQQATKIEQSLKEAENYPLVMTQSQYNRIAAHVLAENRSIPVTFRQLFFELLEDYVDKYSIEETDSIPEAIASALEASKEEPVINRRILENYNTDTGHGYYQLPDGRRSDKMEPEKWREAIRKEWLKGYAVFIDGESASPEETLGQKNLERHLRGFKLLYEGIEGVERELERLGLSLPENMTRAEFMERLESFIITREEQLNPEKVVDLGEVLHTLLNNKSTPASVWHYYQEPPTDLSKLDVLEEQLDRYKGNLSHRLQAGEQAEEINEAAAFTEFRKDYPALFSALKDEIERLLPQAKGLKVSQYNKDISTYGELADRGSTLYQARLTVSQIEIAEYYLTQPGNTYGKRRRALQSGIAIIQEPFNRHRVDEQGDYIEFSDPFSLFMSIDAISESREHREDLVTFRETLIKPALRYLYAYNSVIDLIGKAYEIEGIESLKLGLSTFEGQLSGMNEAIYWLYTYAYGDPAEKNRKRALIKELFLTIHPEELKPTPAAIAKTQEKINALGLSVDAGMKLKTFDALIGSLLERED